MITFTRITHRKQPFYAAFLFILLASFAVAAHAQPQVTFTPFITNMIHPISIKTAGDGSGRLFIAQQDGQIKIYKNGALLSKPFLDLRNYVSHGATDGLYDIEFSPNYKNDRTFFAFYYAKNKMAVLSRFRASKTNPDSAILNSGVTMISITGAGTGGANVGGLHFGPDNYLYFSVNDGSQFGNNKRFAQQGDNFLGKILRLNVLNVNTAPYYTIPPDNPFVNDPNIMDEIWAMGMRNPWRWSFDKLNGDTWIADIGASDWEEVNYVKLSKAAGKNYGWPCYEANDTSNLTGCGNKNLYTFPIFSYAHQSGISEEVITGGAVYRGAAYPSLYGYYICADFTWGNLYKIKPDGFGAWNIYTQVGIPTGIVSFNEDEDGELYAASLYSGIVYRVGAASGPAASTIQPSVNAYSKTKIYPTVVSNHSVTIEMHETYKYAHVYNNTGLQVLRQKLSGIKEKYTLQLPALHSGWYIIKLEGECTMQQKIYIAE